MNHQIGMRIPPKLGGLGMDKLAEWASNAGLDVIDVPYYNEEVKAVLESHNLEVGSIDGVSIGKLLSEDEGKRSEAVEAIKSQISNISQIGGKTIFICLVPENAQLSRDKGFGIWKETFPEVVKHAEDEGVYFAMEGWPGPGPHYPTLGCTPEMVRAMFEVIPSKHFGLNYDPSHLVRLGIDHLRFLTEFGEKVNYCHGKDTEVLTDDLYEIGTLPATFGHKYDFSEGAWRYTIPGHGEVDWGKVAVRLDQVGYTGPISIELEDHRYWGTLEKEQQGIIRAKEHLEKYFK